MLRLRKSKPKFERTVPYVDLKRFMAKWYTIAGRTTFFEKGAHNEIEKYVWNDEHQEIQIDLCFRKGSFEGPLKHLPQTAWVHNPRTNAHWKVQPVWPLEFDYLILAVDPDYQWAAVGVPSQKYLWILCRNPEMPDTQLLDIIARLDRMGYDTTGLKRVPQQKHFNDRNKSEESSEAESYVAPSEIGFPRADPPGKIRSAKS